MIVVNLRNGQVRYPDASRVSTDEHNNLELWTGREGDDLLYVCANGNWLDVVIEVDDGS